MQMSKDNYYDKTTICENQIKYSKLPNEILFLIFDYEPAFRWRHGRFIPRLRSYDSMFLKKLSFLRLKPRLTDYQVCYDNNTLICWSSFTVFLKIDDISGPLLDNSITHIDKLPIYNDFFELKHIRRDVSTINGVPVSSSMSFVFTRIRSLDPEVMFPRKENINQDDQENRTDQRELIQWNYSIRRRIKHSVILSRHLPSIINWKRK